MKTKITQIKKLFREIAKADYKIMERKTSRIPYTQQQLEEQQLLNLNEYFKIYTGDNYFRIQIKKGQLMFLRTFIILNYNTGFEFSIDYSPKKCLITIPNKFINEQNFEQLVDLMYQHVLF